MSSHPTAVCDQAGHQHEEEVLGCCEAPGMCCFFYRQIKKLSNGIQFIAKKHCQKKKEVSFLFVASLFFVVSFSSCYYCPYLHFYHREAILCCSSGRVPLCLNQSLNIELLCAIQSSPVSAICNFGFCKKVASNRLFFIHF